MDYELAKHKIKEIISKSEENIFENIVEFLYDNFESYNWVGIYFVKGKNLILGPWKGLQATEHVKIPIGKGICGSAAASGKTEIVNDVSKDERYISCFLSTRSEIVVPIKKGEKVVAEIDIDSNKKDAFSKKDKKFLEEISDMLSKHI